MKKTAILVLSDKAYATAQKISDVLENTTIYSLKDRVSRNDQEFNSFSQCIQALYKDNITIIALCASGIVIRSLGPILLDKYHEPPVLAVAEDGSVVVPLLGATNGANDMARLVAARLDSYAAITTSGELRFGINLLNPPENLHLVNRDNAKEFITGLLNGKSLRLEGKSLPWLTNARLPIRNDGDLVIQVIDENAPANVVADCLIYREKTQQAAGRVTVIGIGPGDAKYRTLAAERALRQADDILGYDFYIKLAGPFRSTQTIHNSDNRQELDRARHAFSLAANGRKAVLVSSGDPGVFAMAAAVFEVWEEMADNQKNIEVVIEPGITAALAASARFGAPLGHDFAFISLSDNLKPWDIIEKRLRLCSKADLALALYNPVSKARPKQLITALNVLTQERPSTTIIALAHDVTRADEQLTLTTLGELNLEDVTSRTVILVGSSQSRVFSKNDRSWFYTPRFYRA